MAKTNLAKAHIADIPRDNPCAQCGTPIASPDWIEPGEGRISYLWNCPDCGYRFEAMAVFGVTAIEHPPLAA
ncbi:hypothetical protein JIR23_27045 [Bradyrhizobium diazoefficiens]|nr:hypothetical protein [Bradyrhizobium diazoefficiens]QQN63153.1 hypothetical protein JIR23_27045 [Bradyrhizobium diazoefficiens]